MYANVDFPQLINNLRSSKWSYGKIGEEIGKTRDYVRNIGVGRVKSVRYDIGVKLIQLHERTNPNARVPQEQH